MGRPRRWTITEPPAGPGADWDRVKATAATLDRLRLAVDDVFLQSLGQTFGDSASLGALDGLVQFTADLVAAKVGGGPDVAMRLASALRQAVRDELAKTNGAGGPPPAV